MELVDLFARNLWQVFKGISRYIAVWETFAREKARLWFLTGTKRTIYLWDVKENNLISKIKMPEFGLSDAVISHDNSNICLGGMDGTVSVWSIKEEKILKTINVFKGFHEIYYMILSNDGKYLFIYGSHEPISKIFNINSNNLELGFKEIFDHQVHYPYHPLIFTPDNKYLMIKTYGFLHLYESGTWNEVCSIKINY